MYRIETQEELSAHLNRYGDLAFAKLEGLVLGGDLPPNVAEAMFLRCKFEAGLDMPEDMGDAMFVECRMSGLNFLRANLFGARFVR